MKPDVKRAVRRWIIEDYLTFCYVHGGKQSLRAVIDFTKRQEPHALAYLAAHKNLVNFQYV